MAKLFLYIVLFFLQATVFSQKIDQKNVEGQWRVIGGIVGEDTLSLQKISDSVVDFYSFIGFEKGGNFYTEIFMAPNICMELVACLPGGGWKLKNNEIEFGMVTNKGNGNCRYRFTAVYEIIKFSDESLLLKMKKRTNYR